MAVSATQLRKDLFQTLDRALQGETIDVSYKGETILLKPKSGARLAKLVRRDTLMVNPDLIVESDRSLLVELEHKWVAQTL